MKEKINVFEYSREILEALNKGILITSKYEDKVNTMTISWGALGIEWSKPMFTIYVREHRFTTVSYTHLYNPAHCCFLSFAV